VFNPKKRITVEDALEHPYLEDLHIAEDEVFIAFKVLRCFSQQENL